MFNHTFPFSLSASTSTVGGVDTSEILEAVSSAAPDIEFIPKDFIAELPKMGYGMLGIFIVIGIIIGATYLVNFIFKPRNKTPKE